MQSETYVRVQARETSSNSLNTSGSGSSGEINFGITIAWAIPGGITGGRSNHGWVQPTGSYPASLEPIPGISDSSSAEEINAALTNGWQGAYDDELALISGCYRTT